MAEQCLGAHAAQPLIVLLADIEAFDNAGELIDVFGKDANLVGNNSLSLPIGPTLRAGFCAVGAKIAHLGDGKLDWTTVQRLKLVDISRC